MSNKAAPLLGKRSISAFAEPSWIRLQCGRPGFDPWGGKIPWRKGMATHSCILAWRIPWIVQSMELQRFGHDWVTFTFIDVGKDWGQEEKGSTEDEMVGSHHWLSGHKFKQTQGDSEGQGSLACCSPWGHKELDMTEWLNNNIVA